MEDLWTRIISSFYPTISLAYRDYIKSDRKKYAKG